MNPGLWGLIAQMAPNENIASKASMMSMIQPGAASPTGYPMSGGGNQWERTAQQMAFDKYGYTSADWNALDSIIERESGWNPNAVNDSSGAYGIPQILPRAHPNTNLQNDPLGQLEWLFNYIDNRYGSAQNALEFKNTNNWY